VNNNLQLVLFRYNGVESAKCIEKCFWDIEISFSQRNVSANASMDGFHNDSGLREFVLRKDINISMDLDVG
jgi:hypothetical protein